MGLSVYCLQLHQDTAEHNFARLRERRLQAEDAKAAEQATLADTAVKRVTSEHTAVKKLQSKHAQRIEQVGWVLISSYALLLV